MKFAIAVACIFVSVSAQARPLPFFSKQDMTPYWISENAALSPATVPAFHFRNQNNSPVNGIRPQISLVNFFFTTCRSVCPVMMNTIEEYRDRWVHNVVPLIYSISVDPETDQPKQLNEYAKNHHLHLQNWSLLTGSRDEIYRIGREVFHADGSQKSEDFIHTTNLYLIDSKRRVRGIYDTKSSKDMGLLTADLKKIALEK